MVQCRSALSWGRDVAGSGAAQALGLAAGLDPDVPESEFPGAGGG